MGLIKSLQIKNSAFFGDNVRIDFSPKMNCIMGGRGTGKTTLLTVLYWAINQDDNLPKEMLSLVKSNLGSGTAEVMFQDEQGNDFMLFKAFGDVPTVKNAAGAFVSFDDFSARIGIDFFPAGAIERIGLDPKHRLRLFDGHVGKGIAEANGQIGILVSQLKQSEIQIKTCRRELSQIKEELLAFGTIDDELLKAKAELSAVEGDAGLKSQFELENKKQTKRSLEQNFLTKARDANLNVAQHIERLRAGISSALTLFSATSELESPTVKAFSTSALLRFQSAAKLVDDLHKLTNLLNSELVATTLSAREEHERAESEFSTLKQTIAKHRDLFQRINNLSQRATAKQIALEKVQSLTVQLGTLTGSRAALMTELNGLIASRADLRRKTAIGVNELLGHKVKILMKEFALNEPFEEILKAHLSRLQMRLTGAERRILEVSNPQALAASIAKDDAEGYARQCEILDVSRMKNLFKAFRETDIIYELEACICEDAPNFYLGVEDANSVESFKPTEELSTGQRCTAVLPVIFAMTTRPLLIDQPEDNLDNRYITQTIHQIIRNIKDKRQMVFVTHNPNIPVISDSEFNTFLAYFDQRSHVLAVGNIQEVKTQIIDLLEGGKEAFVRRKDTYGY
jgi:energy-coupling factor transporter ATP-binding protein EcfA2